MRYKEIETKYDATNIKLTDFIKLIKSFDIKYNKEEIVGNFDHYYFKKDFEGLARYRAGDKPQLTTKEKSTDKNNYIRTEMNINLGDNTLDAINKYWSILGFDHNFSIFKNCFIYWYDNYNLVYYVVYDADMKEKDRFIEIEMAEEFPWPSDESAWNELIKIEKTLAPLGITPNHRLKLSLGERYRK